MFHSKLYCSLEVRIGNLQRVVVSSVQSSSPDPIAESEITHELKDHFTKMKVSNLQQKEILSNLESTFPISSCGAAVLHAEPEDHITEEELPQEDPMEIHESSRGEPARPDKRRKAVNLRAERLGQNPRESRQLPREQLQSGFYLSHSGKKIFPDFASAWIMLQSWVQYCRMFPSMTRSATYVHARTSKQIRKTQAEHAHPRPQTWLIPTCQQLEEEIANMYFSRFAESEYWSVSESEYWNDGSVAPGQYLSGTHNEKAWTVVCQRNTENTRGSHSLSLIMNF